MKWTDQRTEPPGVTEVTDAYGVRCTKDSGDEDRPWVRHVPGPDGKIGDLTSWWDLVGLGSVEVPDPPRRPLTFADFGRALTESLGKDAATILATLGVVPRDGRGNVTDAAKVTGLGAAEKCADCGHVAHSGGCWVPTTFGPPCACSVRAGGHPYVSIVDETHTHTAQQLRDFMEVAARVRGVEYPVPPVKTYPSMDELIDAVKAESAFRNPDWSQSGGPHVGPFESTDALGEQVYAWLTEAQAEIGEDSNYDAARTSIATAAVLADLYRTARMGDEHREYMEYLREGERDEDAQLQAAAWLDAYQALAAAVYGTPQMKVPDGGWVLNTQHLAEATRLKAERLAGELDRANRILATVRRYRDDLAEVRKLAGIDGTTVDLLSALRVKLAGADMNRRDTVELIDARERLQRIASALQPLGALVDAPPESVAHQVADLAVKALRERLTWNDVSAWIHRQRDRLTADSDEWHAMNDALDNFREHMHTGTPLDQEVRGYDWEPDDEYDREAETIAAHEGDREPDTDTDNTWQGDEARAAADVQHGGAS